MLKSNRRPSLRKATMAGLGLIVLFLLFNVLVSQRNTQRLIENQSRVVRTQEVLTTLEAVLARVTEAETAERGFLITGDEDYLKSYQLAIDRTEKTLDRLSTLAGGDGPRHNRIAALKERVEARFDELRRAIAAQRAEGFDAAKHSVSTNQGRRLMNEMRGLVGEMQDEEQQAFDIRSAESSRTAQVTRATNVVGSLMGIGMVAVAFFLFRRKLIHRQRADDAPSPAGGDRRVVRRRHRQQVAGWPDRQLECRGAALVRLYGRRSRRPADFHSLPAGARRRGATQSGSRSQRRTHRTLRNEPHSQGRTPNRRVAEHLAHQGRHRRRHRRLGHHPRHHRAKATAARSRSRSPRGSSNESARTFTIARARS